MLLDETGADTTVDLAFGRPASNARVDGPVPPGHPRTAAVRLGGVIEPACMAFEGATNAASFEFDEPSAWTMRGG